MPDRYADILVVDLLGGIGDLIMILPVVHALARRNPGASLRVLTHDPGADLVRGDPSVTEVHTPAHGRPGAEREAVARVLAERRPDLAVTTTRYDGIPGLLAASGARCVTDLWRRPPPGEPVGLRYLRILQAEGLLGHDDPGDLARPRVHLNTTELARGRRLLGGCLPAAAHRPPAVLVTGGGMAVKHWPYWTELAGMLAERGHPVLVVGEPPGAGPPDVEPSGRGPLGVGPIGGPPFVLLPAVGLRDLAACFAAVAGLGGVVVGGDTGPVRLAAAAGATTVGLFGPTSALRYGIGGGVDLQGLPDCPHRLPTAITEQPCWWTARCPLTPGGRPACMADIPAWSVADAVTRLTTVRR
ncbi:glycosyltransferase family 9 protein [Sphaerimonospora sp. CA-214678]|uniref:glycosyltransferase family 9 protein n=1 Tax=Sphaerimonospora sp. CA-214678 TaxID=3240029 RepID=UPI003D8B1068